MEMAANIGRPTEMTKAQAALWNWMERKGFDQRETAKELKIHWVTLNAILSGRKRPGLAVAVKIQTLTGIAAGLWMDTRVRHYRRADDRPLGSLGKSEGYSHAS